jgi:mono/diheme cytochrome c family protein
MANTINRGALALAFTLILTGPALAADDSESRTAAAGKQVFMDNCAVCHGADGRGAGIVAGHLAEVPTNLTTLSANNGGNFPFPQIYETIDGRRQIGAHGSREMPIWGAAFRQDTTSAGGMREAVVRGRILELIVYIQSIQE